MATGILRGRYILNGLDLTDMLHGVAFGRECETVDETSLANDTRVMRAGLKTASFGLELFSDQAADDLALFTAISAAADASAVGPIIALNPLVATGSIAAGDVAFFANVRQQSMKQGAGVGELMQLSLSLFGQDDTNGVYQDLHRGLASILQTCTNTVTVNGTASQLGALANSGVVATMAYAILNLSGSPSITLRLQSSADNVTYTNRSSTAALTANGSAVMTPQAGPITDTWWRARAECTGTGSALVIAAIARTVK